MTENDADASVERVLAGLRGVEPGIGMAERVLRRLEAAPERQTPAAWSWVSWTAAVLAVGVVAAVALQQRAVPRRGTIVTSSQAEVADRRSVVAPATVRPGAEQVSDERLPPRVRTPAVPGKRAHKVAATAAVPVSFPAPPMPLTRQERLLLHMLRRGEATELVATAGPRAERAVRSQERAEFSEFFQPHVAPGTEVLRDTGLEDGAAGSAAR